MKQQDRIPLYEDRSVSQCIEATFDFMRVNRRVWLRSALALFMPVSLLLGLSVLTVEPDQVSADAFFLDQMYVWGIQYSLLFEALVVVGVWMAFVHVYSLLQAYEQMGEKLNEASQRQLVPSYSRVARRSWWLAIMLAGGVYLMGSNQSILWVTVTWLVMVPLALLPSVVIIERKGDLPALAKSVRLGFKAWLPLFFTLVLTLLLGFLMTLSVQLPSMLMGMMFSSLAYEGAQTDTLSLIGVYGFTTLIYWGHFLVISMILMACAYEYGAVSERVDDASLENEIAHFEEL